MFYFSPKIEGWYLFVMKNKTKKNLLIWIDQDYSINKFIPRPMSSWESILKNWVTQSFKRVKKQFYVCGDGAGWWNGHPS